MNCYTGRFSCNLKGNESKVSTQRRSVWWHGAVYEPFHDQTQLVTTFFSWPPPLKAGPLGVHAGCQWLSLLPTLSLSLAQEKRHVEALACCSQLVTKALRAAAGELTFAIAFLYLMAAWSMRLRTCIFPSPHGTTTRVLPKHTVTFISPPLP